MKRRAVESTEKIPGRRYDECRAAFTYKIVLENFSLVFSGLYARSFVTKHLNVIAKQECGQLHSVVKQSGTKELGPHLLFPASAASSVGISGRNFPTRL